VKQTIGPLLLQTLNLSVFCESLSKKQLESSLLNVGQFHGEHC